MQQIQLVLVTLSGDAIHKLPSLSMQMSVCFTRVREEWHCLVYNCESWGK